MLESKVDNLEKNVKTLERDIKNLEREVCNLDSEVKNFRKETNDNFKVVNMQIVVTQKFVLSNKDRINSIEVATSENLKDNEKWYDEVESLRDRLYNIVESQKNK